MSAHLPAGAMGRQHNIVASVHCEQFFAIVAPQPVRRPASADGQQLDVIRPKCEALPGRQLLPSRRRDCHSAAPPSLPLVGVSIWMER